MSSDTERIVHDLGSLLEALLQGNSDIRKPAESRLQDLVSTSPAETLYGLALIGQGVAAYPLECRCLSLVLLRRLAFTSLPRTTLAPPHDTPFDIISEQQRARVEQCLISGLEGEIEGKVRKGLADVVGRWVEESGKRGRPLTSLQPLLLRLTSSPSPLHRLTTYQLLSATPSLLCHAPTISGTQDQPAVVVTPEQVANVLEMGIGDQIVQVRVEAVKAICQVLGSSDAMDKKGRERVGKGLVEKVVQVLIALATDPTHYDQVITPLIELASYYPNLFSTSLPTLLPFLQCLCLPPTSSLPSYLLPNTYTSIPSPPPITFPPDDIRSSPTADPESISAAENERFERTIEFLLTLTETSKKSVLKTWVKEGGLQMIPVLLGRMIVGLGEREGIEAETKLGDWLEEEDLDAEDESYPIIPEDSLDRLSGVLPMAPFLQNLFGFIAQMVTDPDWRARTTGLLSIAAVGETTVDVMVESLQQIIQMILPLAQDPHPRVRYALCHCLGQLATDFEGTFLQQLAPQILQTEISLLDDPQNRVRAHAAASLVNLSDIATADIIRPYLDSFMQGILKMLQNTPIYVQEQALTTLASIALASEKDFAQYYGSVMPMLLSVLREPAASGKEYRMMRARAMECCGLIGMAVGKEIFQADALQLAHIMAQIQSEVTDDDDPQISYLTMTWSKLAACLKADFVPFLPYVMPTLLAKAGQKPDMIRIDDPELAAADGYHVVGLAEDEQVGIKTSGIEEKATNFECMTIYIASLGTALGSYLNQMLDLCLEGMRFLFDDRVRTAAIDTLPLLLQLSKETGNSEAIEKIFSSFNECFLREDQVEYLSLLYMKFHRCLELIASPLPPTLRQSFDQATEFQLSAMHDERTRRRQELSEMDKSQRDEQIEWEEEEDAALDEMSKALFLVDENHPLLLSLSLVRGLAIKDAEEWEDEGEEED